MATVAANGLSPDDPNNQQPNAGGSGTVMNSAGGGVSSGGAAPSGGASTAPRANPGGAPNVQDYLTANQGAGQRLSTGITNNVQNQANQVSNQANTYGQQLNSQYQPLNSTLQGGQQAANTAFQDPQALLTAYQNAQSQSNPTPGTTPTAPNQSDLANYNAFQGDVAGTNQYNQNQQQIQNYNTTGQQANNALQTQLGTLAQSTGSAANEMGRNQLLQNTVGNPNYNQGQQTLDSLFLQGAAPQLQQNLGNIQNTTANAVNAQNTDYQQKLAALQGLSSGNTAYASNLFLNGPGSATGAPTGTGLNQIGSNVANEYNAAQAAAAAPATTGGTNLASLQAAAALKGGQGQFSQAQLAALQAASGTTPLQTAAYGTSLTPYLSGDVLSNTGAAGTAANATGNAQVANANEFARYNALNQLAGGPSGALQNNIFGSATSAGGYNPVSVNSTGFNTAAQNAQSAVTGTDFNTAIQNALQGFSSVGKVGEGSNAVGQVYQSLQDAQKAGTLTPTQAQQIMQQYLPGLQAMGTGLGNPLAGYNTYENYYNNEYLPDASDILGQTPLATNQGTAVKKI